MQSKKWVRVDLLLGTPFLFSHPIPAIDEKTTLDTTGCSRL